MPAQLTYGGVSLFLPDSRDVKNLDYLDDYLPPDEVHDHADPYVFNSERMQHRTPRSHRINLPRLTFGPTPKPRINQLWWPTGASRWARGYFLCDQTALDAIRKELDDESQPLPLVAKTDEDEFTTDLFLLTPRRITAVRDSKAIMWLLPLVDVRYHWQFHRGMTEEKIRPGTSWRQLFERLRFELSIADFEFPEAESTSYLWPDDHEFTRRKESVAVLLDAAAWSVGGIVVRQLDGTVAVAQFSGGQSVHDSNIDDDDKWALAAGGKADVAPVAEEVTSVFKYSNMGALCDGVHTITKRAGDDVETELPLISNTQFHAQTAAYAEVKGGSFNQQTGEFIPANNTALDALATRRAEDYYTQRSLNYDYCFQRIKEWTFGAFDDAALYSFGSPLNEGEEIYVSHGHDDGKGTHHADIEQFIYPEWRTRITSLPHDFGATEFLNQERLAFHGLRWGVTITPALPPDPDETGHLCPYTVVNPCDDCQGNGVNPDIRHEVILPGRRGFGIGLSPGNIISYHQSDPDCRWTITSDYSVTPHRLKGVLSEKLWPEQLVAFLNPLTVFSMESCRQVIQDGFKINTAWNVKRHAAARGMVAYLDWDQCMNFGQGGYYVSAVEKRTKQVVIDVNDTLDCLAQAKLATNAEFADDPGNYCTIALYDDCQESTPPPQNCLVQYQPVQFDDCFPCCIGGPGPVAWKASISSGSFSGGPGGCCDRIQQTFDALGTIPLNIRVDQCTWISSAYIIGCDDAPFILCFRLSPYVDVFGVDPTAQLIDARLSMADDTLTYLNDNFNCNDPQGGGLALELNSTGCATVPDLFLIEPVT